MLGLWHAAQGFLPAHRTSPFFRVSIWSFISLFVHKCFREGNSSDAELLHLLLCNDKPINSRSSEGAQVLGAARLFLGMYSSTLGTFLGEFGLGDVAKHDACNLIGSALDEVFAAPLYKGLGFRNIRILTSHILVYCCLVKLTLDRIRSTHSFIWCLETFESPHFQATRSYTAILSVG